MTAINITNKMCRFIFSIQVHLAPSITLSITTEYTCLSFLKCPRVSYLTKTKITFAS